MLLGIIMFSILKGFSLVCGPWAFPITPVIIIWDKRTGLSFWISAKDLGVSLDWPLPWAWRVGLRALFFKPYQLPPSPCVRYTWARAVTCLASGAISTCLLGVGLVRAWSPSFVL